MHKTCDSGNTECCSSESEYDIDEDDIADTLDRLDLGRFKAWLSYNNYI